MMILSQYHIFELDTINIYSAGGRAKLYDRDKIWSSINHSILSSEHTVYTVHTSFFYILQIISVGKFAVGKLIKGGRKCGVSLGLFNKIELPRKTNCGYTFNSLICR
jgi:hypothetical protein